MPEAAAAGQHYGHGVVAVVVKVVELYLLVVVVVVSPRK